MAPKCRLGVMSGPCLRRNAGTLITYSVDAQIGGKLAQLGQRLINGAAKKMADEFFQKFAPAVGKG